MNKAFAILVSSLILLSSLNFNLSAHYCGTQLIDVALFGEADQCAMAKENSLNPKKKSCCENRVILIEGEDYLASKDFNVLEVKKVDVLLNLFTFPIDLFIQDKFLEVEKYHYFPPLNQRKISILLQSFLL